MKFMNQTIIAVLSIAGVNYAFGGGGPIELSQPMFAIPTPPQLRSVTSESASTVVPPVGSPVYFTNLTNIDFRYSSPFIDNFGQFQPGDGPLISSGATVLTSVNSSLNRITLATFSGSEGYKNYYYNSDGTRNTANDIRPGYDPYAMVGLYCQIVNGHYFIIMNSGATQPNPHLKKFSNFTGVDISFKDGAGNIMTFANNTTTQVNVSLSNQPTYYPDIELFMPDSSDCLYDISGQRYIAGSDHCTNYILTPIRADNADNYILTKK